VPDEADPGRDHAAPAGPHLADVDDHLGGVRAGDQVGRAQQVEEVGVCDPPAARDDLVAQHGDMGRRPAEGGEAEPQGQQRNLRHRTLRRGRALSLRYEFLHESPPSRLRSGALNWVARCLPGGEPAVEGIRVVAARTEQLRGALAARGPAVTHVSVGHYGAVGRNLAQACGQLIARQVERTGDMSGGVLVSAANVDHSRGAIRSELLSKLLRTHVGVHPQFLSGMAG
jgi:hypothetical protein